MVTSDIIALAVLVTIIIGGFWAVYTMGTKAKDKHQDERHAATAKAVDEADQKTQETRKVLFKRVDDMQKEINTLQTELAKTTGLLEGHLKAMHEDAHIDRTVKQLEDRIEKRLEGISAQMEGQTQLLHQLLAARAPLGNS